MQDYNMIYAPRYFFKIDIVIIFLLFLLFLSASFDIFLNLNIYGFNIRLFYAIEFLLFLIFIYKVIVSRVISIFVGGKTIAIWFLFVMVFVPNTTFIVRSIGYALWLFFSILLILLMVNMLKNIVLFYKIFNLFVLSFFIISCFGIMQFIAGLIGIDLLVSQWWEYGRLPRVNGFSYEPSYYATYMIIGWSILLYIYYHGFILQKKYKLYFYIITISIFISSSRMGILVMVIALFILFLKDVLRLKIRIKSIKFAFISGLCLLSFAILFVINLNNVQFLLSGLGFFEGSSHSSSIRLKEQAQTIEIFLKSPLVGYSLGGVASAIGALNGIEITSQDEAKQHEGMNIIVEVLAASGIIGFLFFIVFFLLMYKKAYKVSKALAKENYEYSIIINSLAFALIIETIMLMMNQNILRPYFWILVAVFNTSITLGKRVVDDEFKKNCN